MSREIHVISLVKRMEGQKTRDVGAMIVQKGYKLSFIIVVIRGKTDQMRNSVGFMCDYPPTHPL